jgi:hypothetical protein
VGNKQATIGQHMSSALSFCCHAERSFAGSFLTNETWAKNGPEFAPEKPSRHCEEADPRDDKSLGVSR